VGQNTDALAEEIHIAGNVVRTGVERLDIEPLFSATQLHSSSRGDRMQTSGDKIL
jgi:hypothetical protein